MENVIIFGYYAGIFVGAIAALKVFFTLWAVVDRKLNPGKVENALETSFKSLKKKKVFLKLKDGSILDNHKYIKSLYFEVSEYGALNPVYFEFKDPEEKTVFVSGSEIVSITCVE